MRMSVRMNGRSEEATSQAFVVHRRNKCSYEWRSEEATSQAFVVREGTDVRMNGRSKE